MSHKRLIQWLVISAFLVSIITANLLVSIYGALVVIPVGFLLVGFDITTRDYLHEIWANKRWLKMGLLIGIGSLLSWLLNNNSGKIALASFIAFASSEIIDTLTYTFLYKRHYFIKVNGSNLFSSFTDSTVFLTIAFGQFMPLLILGQFASKFIGGFMWSWIIYRLSHRKKVATSL